ncbi:MAG: HEAT repeat domain-containing protein [Gaiellales bacterium]
MGGPKVEKMKSKRDLAGLVGVIDSSEDRETRVRAIDAAIDLVLEDVYETQQNIAWSQILAAALATAASRNDDLALQSLTRIVAREFGEKGNFYADTLRTSALDGLRTLGSLATPTLIRLLDHEDSGVRMDAASYLGKIGFDTGDTSALRKLATAGIDENNRSSNRRTRYFVQEECYLAAKNIEGANSDGYNKVLAEMSDDERGFLSVYPSDQ